MVILSMKEFGAALRDRRKELGYTQKALAERTGFSASFISNLENGKETVEMGKALYLADILELDVLLEDRRSDPSERRQEWIK